MIFPRQLEVEQRHADERRHDNEEDERKEEDAKQGVNLMTPHRRKDVMQLDVNRTEGQESRNDHLEESAAVPRHLRGNFACHLGSAGGCIKVVAGVILGRNSPHDGKGEGNQGVKRGDGKDCREGQCAGTPVSQRDGIHPHEHDARGNGEQPRREEDATHPRLTVHLEVKSGANEGSDGTS